ncbi:MAG: serine/threonine-protein kinase [Nannocystaceae bacterium]
MAKTLQGLGPREFEAGPTSEAVITALTEVAKRMGIAIGIHPGLDDDAPPLAEASPGRYVLGAEIGSGGGGRVYLATDRDIRRSVALKVLAERHVGVPQRVQAFLEEAIITAGLEHPNIVPIYDLGWSPALGFFYTMKRLTGRPLVDILDQQRAGDREALRAFDLPRALALFVDVCRAVAHAHQRGVLHSDIKPDNIVVGEYGEIVVVDWGMAQLLDPTGETQVRAHLRGGTPEYMAPEQFTEAGAKLGVEVDVWSLGILLYELLTLSVPFRGGGTDEIGMRVMIEPITPPSRRAPGRPIPSGIEQICMRALERLPERRYPTVTELLGDVEAWIAGTRERMRRSERLAHALETAEAILEPIAERELHIDALLAAEADAATLSDLRDELADAYALATDTLLRALDLEPDAAPHQRLAGDLYWRIFTRLYPSTVSPSEALSERCTALLAALSQRACAAIVQAGRDRAADDIREIRDSSAQGSDDAQGSVWLSVATMVADHDAPAPMQSAMHSILARVGSLKEISLFGAMPSASLLPIAEACHELDYPAGAMIFRQNDPGDTLYVLLDGYVDILRDGAVINTLSPGECFGEIAVLGETTRTASASAVDAVRTLALDAPRFRKIVRDNGEIGLAVIQALNDRLRLATRREAALRTLASTILKQGDAPEI